VNDSFSFGAIRRKLDATRVLHTPPKFSDEDQARALGVMFRTNNSADCQPPEDICHCCGQLIRRSH